jgi:hypothetical protein
VKRGNRWLKTAVNKLLAEDSKFLLPVRVRHNADYSRDKIGGNSSILDSILKGVIFMSDKPDGGDNITVGDIINAQGVAVGRGASVRVTGNNIPGDVEINAGELRAALEELYDALEQGGLPRDKTRAAQTAAGNAIAAVTDKEVKGDVVVDNVKRIGETLKQANVAVKEGSSLWGSIKKLASVLGPLVGGARAVGAWFGFTF